MVIVLWHVNVQLSTHHKLRMAHWHFLFLAYNLCLLKTPKTFSRCFLCSNSFSKNTNLSSMRTKVNTPKYYMNITFIIFINIRVAYFLPCIIHCHGPTNFAIGEAKEVLPLQISKDHDRDMSFSHTHIYCKTFFIITRKKRE